MVKSMKCKTRRDKGLDLASQFLGCTARGWVTGEEEEMRVARVHRGLRGRVLSAAAGRGLPCASILPWKREVAVDPALAVHVVIGGPSVGHWREHIGLDRCLREAVAMLYEGGALSLV